VGLLKITYRGVSAVGKLLYKGLVGDWLEDAILAFVSFGRGNFVVGRESVVRTLINVHKALTEERVEEAIDRLLSAGVIEQLDGKIAPEGVFERKAWRDEL